MSIRAVGYSLVRACPFQQAIQVPHRAYSQDSRLSLGQVLFRAFAPKICPWFVPPGPLKADAPQYNVLTKAECEAHDERLWNKELKKASEEFEKVTKK